MLKDWQLKYNVQLNKWGWVDTRVFKEGPLTRNDSGRNKNGFYPYDFDFIRFVKGAVSQCSYCGKFMLTRKLTRDHVYPKSKGGVIVAPACRPCNDIKRDYLPIDFAIKHSESGRAWGVIPIGFDPTMQE